MKLDPLRPGRKPTTEQYNKLIKAVNALMNIKGRNGIRVQTTPYGTTLIGTPVSAATGVGGAIFPAIAAQDAPASNLIRMAVTTGSSGESFLALVNCEIVGTGVLNSAIPRLEQGDKIYVVEDANAQSGWRSVMTFQSTIDCS